MHLQKSAIFSVFFFEKKSHKFYTQKEDPGINGQNLPRRTIILGNALLGNALLGGSW